MFSSWSLVMPKPYFVPRLKDWISFRRYPVHLNDLFLKRRLKSSALETLQTPEKSSCKVDIKPEHLKSHRYHGLEHVEKRGAECSRRWNLAGGIGYQVERLETRPERITVASAA